LDALALSPGELLDAAPVKALELQQLQHLADARGDLVARPAAHTRSP